VSLCLFFHRGGFIDRFTMSVVAALAIENARPVLSSTWTRSQQERDWLQGVASKSVRFSGYYRPNEVASSILRPLIDLLRANGVYLLVEQEETERSGLLSAKYGNAPYALEAANRLAQNLTIGAGHPPFLKHHLDRKPAGTRPRSVSLASVIGAPIVYGEFSAGKLLAVKCRHRAHGTDVPSRREVFTRRDLRLLEEAASLLAIQVQNIGLVLQGNELFLGTLHAMSQAIDARDQYTLAHSRRVARLSSELAKLRGLSDKACQEIYLAGILHDIGKIGIPDSVLLKEGTLTPAEFAIIRQHPEIGHRIVEKLGHLQFALPGVLHHHERWDGRGYPHQLGKESIPLMARIMSVADAFDAMTSSRPYRTAMSVQSAHDVIQDGAGEQWDTEVVACLSEWLRGCTQRLQTTLEHDHLFPDESPMEHIGQAVLTLVNEQR
jgi:HD-GYP domain-containing protein (c-di-GMP phosphodiesterase class II)